MSEGSPSRVTADSLRRYWSWDLKDLIVAVETGRQELRLEWQKCAQGGWAESLLTSVYNMEMGIMACFPGNTQVNVRRCWEEENQVGIQNDWGDRATDSAWEKHGSADVPEQSGEGGVKIREWETRNQFTQIHGPKWRLMFLGGSEQKGDLTYVLGGSLWLWRTGNVTGEHTEGGECCHGQAGGHVDKGGREHRVCRWPGVGCGSRVKEASKVPTWATSRAESHVPIKSRWWGTGSVAWEEKASQDILGVRCFSEIQEIQTQ